MMLNFITIRLAQELKMQNIFLVVIIFFSQSLFASGYGDWERKYPDYKFIFSKNQDLYKSYEAVYSISSKMIHEKRNTTKSDREIINYLRDISNQFFTTYSLMNVYGQTLVFSFSSTLDTNMKSLHFNEACSNLNSLLPSKPSNTKDRQSYKLSLLEWGKEISISKPNLTIISKGLDEQYEVSQWMEKTCLEVTTNNKFWTVKK
jgi:hypothetical protein